LGKGDGWAVGIKAAEAAPEFLEQAVNLCKAMKPFLDYLNRVLQ
jgi:hypothetical protein